MLKFFIALLIAATFGIIAFAGREAKKKIKQKKEDRVMFGPKE